MRYSRLRFPGTVGTWGQAQSTDRAASQRSPWYSLVLGTRIDVVTGPELLHELGRATPSHPVHLGYVNAHSLNLAYTDQTYRNALQGCAYILNDGVGLSLAARMRGVTFPDDLNGSDFTLRLLALASERDWRVFLYGGRPGVAERAAGELGKRVPRVWIVGVHDGFRERAEIICRNVGQVVETMVRG